MQFSARAEIITRRTYNRPLDNNTFETWTDTIDRSISHQCWLWERACGCTLNADQIAELDELRTLMLERKVCVSGRSLWLGGTEIGRRRESSLFNCSYTHVETVYDVVDVLWLLLQGCGVGFTPVAGTLSGFSRPIPNIEVVRSQRIEKGGRENNFESFDAETGEWIISLGDSAEAWAKSIGKLIAGKLPARKLVLDFSEIRPAGSRLSGYGWICSGDADIARAFLAIAQIFNRRAGSLLTKIDILDVINWLGTVLSSRRSAELALLAYGDPEWREFATAKKDCGETGNPQRQQSNNTLLFYTKPTREELNEVFDLMIDSGGSEPGFANAQAAMARAPWFSGFNPCGEILLANKSFCCLTEVDTGKFRGDTWGLLHAVHITARANYRQTCVDLRDGILQESWHLNNEFLRLCGTSLTGIVRRPDLTAYDFRHLERTATAAAIGMADELDLPRPKNVTCVKPSGTLGKIMDTTEGNHRPLGRYVLNHVTFSRHDELIPILRKAGYRIAPKPYEQESVLITLPVAYPDVPFNKVHGLDVNAESAISQLERYRLLVQNYSQQNVSQTIYYDPSEKDAIIDWLDRNWDYYVAVSFLFRPDPTKTAADLGYSYLPQEVVTREVYEDYVKGLKPVDLSNLSGD
jgi:ribonucleoside-triphosphate reductase